MSRADAFRAAVWLGLVGGAVEVASLGVVKFAGLAVPEGRLAMGVAGQRHGYLWLSPHVTWMAPATQAATLAVVAVVLLILLRFLPEAVRGRTLLGALVFTVGLSLLWTFPRLHWAAAAVLAAGVAVQGARWLDRHGPSFQRVLRRSTGWLVAATALGAVAMGLWESHGGRLRARALPAAPTAAPNVVLLILDTARAANLSVYGYGRRTTPNLERLAEGGLAFDRAYSTSPWTLPAHVSAFTGRWPYEFSADWFVPYEGEHATLAEVLSANGYATAGFVANLVYTAYESGLARGFLHYEDYPIGPWEALLSTGLGRKTANSPAVRRLFGFYDIAGRKNAETITDDFLAWHDRHRDRPFFAFLNFLDAHEPYLPPAPFDTRFGPQEARRPETHTYPMRLAILPGRDAMPPAEQQAELDAYDGALAYIDEQVGRLLRSLEDRNEMERTVVIVMSDHGEQFGEHGLHLHGNSLYDPVLRVPLILAYGDRLPAGLRVREPVSVRDLPATVTALARIDEHPFPGASLERFWTGSGGEPAGAEAVESEFTDIRGTPTVKSVVYGRYHYIWSEEGHQALYDVVSDPAEERNLVAEREYDDVVLEMRRLMAPHVRGDSILWERLPQRDPAVP